MISVSYFPNRSLTVQDIFMQTVAFHYFVRILRGKNSWLTGFIILGKIDNRKFANWNMEKLSIFEEF